MIIYKILFTPIYIALGLIVGVVLTPIYAVRSLWVDEDILKEFYKRIKQHEGES